MIFHYKTYNYTIIKNIILKYDVIIIKIFGQYRSVTQLSSTAEYLQLFQFCL